MDDWFAAALQEHNYDDPSYFDYSTAGEEESDADTPTIDDVGMFQSRVCQPQSVLLRSASTSAL